MSKGSFAQLRLAKIAAWQAIVVALITTLGGALVGTLITGNRATVQAGIGQTQHCLTIRGVKSISGAENIDRIHISGSVNSLASFAYPTQYPWQDLKAEMPVVRLLLPATEGTLRVEFSGFAEDATGKVIHLCGLESQKVASLATAEEKMAFLSRGTASAFGTDGREIESPCASGASFAVAYAIEKCVDFGDGPSK